MSYTPQSDIFENDTNIAGTIGTGSLSDLAVVSPLTFTDPTLEITPAGALSSGYITTTTQQIAGNKIFNGNLTTAPTGKIRKYALGNETIVTPIEYLEVGYDSGNTEYTLKSANTGGSNHPINIDDKMTFSNGVTTSYQALDIIDTTTPQLKVVYDNSNFIKIQSNSAGVGLLQTSGNELDISSTDTLKLLNTLSSTDTSIGSLVCLGGVSIYKDLYVNGNVTAANYIYQNVEYITATIQSDNPSSGASIVSGGEGIAKNLNVGGVLRVWDTTQSINTLTGSVIIDGGCAIAKDLYVGDTLHFSSSDGSVTQKSLHLTSTVASTSMDTGALICDGGVGIAGDINLGGALYSFRNIKIDSSSDGATYDKLNVTGFHSDPLLHTQLQLNSNSGGIALIDVSPSNQIEIFSGITKTIEMNSSYIYLPITTNSISRSSGALVVDGGIGCSKDLHIGNIIYTNTMSVLSTIDSSDPLSGSMLLNGGIGCSKNIHSLGYMKSHSTTDSISNTTGSIICLGGLGIVKNVNIGGVTKLSNGNFGSDYLTGSLVVAGSIGMSGNMYANGSMNCIYGIKVQGASQPYEIYTETDNVHQRNYGGPNTWYHENIDIFNNTNDATNVDSGSIICKGGIGITKSVFVGGNMYFSGTIYGEYAPVITLPTSAGAILTVGTNFQTYNFSGSVAQSLFFNIDVSHSWKPESNLSVHAHYTNENNNAGNVEWSLTYSITSPGGTYNATGTTLSTVTVANQATNYMFMEVVGTIPMTGITAYGTIISCRLQRLANTDSYAGFSRVQAVQVHYQIDRMGSTSI